MVKAWEIAKKGQKNFGGKVSEYLSEALKMAWALIKKGANKLAKYPKVVYERAEHFFKTGDQPTKEFAKNKAVYEYEQFVKDYKVTNNFRAKKGQKTMSFESLVSQLEEITVDDYVKIVTAASNFAKNYAR